jgi:hypothetical protein
MKLIKILFIVAILMASSAIAMDCNTRCEKGVCNTLIGQTFYVEQDKGCIEREKARSLVNTPLYLEIDSDGLYLAECPEYNWTHYTCDLELSKNALGQSNTFKEIPIRIGNEYFKENVTFKNVVETKRIVFDVSKSGNKTVKIGEHSTEIILQDADNETLEDTYIDQSIPDTNYGSSTAIYSDNSSSSGKEDNLLIKFNVSQITSDEVIIAAYVNLFLYSNDLDNSSEGFNLSIYHLYNKTWVETYPTWNNLVNLGLINGTRESTNYFFGGEYPVEPIGWQKWSVLSSTRIAVFNNESNVSYILKPENVFGNPLSDYMAFYAKERATVAQRPYLNITYGLETTPPTSNSPPDASYEISSSATINWTLTDNIAGGYYNVTRNGTTQNGSTVWVSGSTIYVWVNTSTIGNYWNYTIFFNDSAGNNGAPDTVFINITPAITHFLENLTNSTLAGTNIMHSVKVEDGSGLSGYIFSFDNGTRMKMEPVWQNDSYVAMTGILNWSNVTKTINSTVGTTISWKVYVNDTLGNWAESPTYSYVTTTDCDSENINATNTIDCSCTISDNFNISAHNLNITGTGNLLWNAVGHIDSFTKQNPTQCNISINGGKMIIG